MDNMKRKSRKRDHSGSIASEGILELLDDMCPINEANGSHNNKPELDDLNPVVKLTRIDSPPPTKQTRFSNGRYSKKNSPANVLNKDINRNKNDINEVIDEPKPRRRSLTRITAENNDETPKTSTVRGRRTLNLSTQSTKNRNSVDSVLQNGVHNGEKIAVKKSPSNGESSNAIKNQEKELEKLEMLFSCTTEDEKNSRNSKKLKKVSIASPPNSGKGLNPTQREEVKALISEGLSALIDILLKKPA